MTLVARSRTPRKRLFGEDRSGLVVALTSLAATAVLLAVTSVIAFAFLLGNERSKVDELEEAVGAQSQRVAELEQADKKILSDHTAIGEHFADQTTDLRRVLNVVQPQAQQAPLNRRALARFARRGFLVPGRIPRPVARRRATIMPHQDGYAIVWRESMALFASSARDPAFAVLIAQAPPSVRRKIDVGGRRLTEISRPPVILAWTPLGRSYTVVAPGRDRAEAVALVAAMR